jgi:LysM repeat protein
MLPPAMNRRRPSIAARIAAPLALAVVVVAVYMIVQDNRSTDTDGGGGTTSIQQTTNGAPTATVGNGKSPAKKRSRRVYVVKSGDLLSTVAEKTGLTVDELQELNPDLDPQALQVGQRLKLRAAADPDKDGTNTTTTP